jgi:predicted nucleotidyltransferase component of viral defense system
LDLKTLQFLAQAAGLELTLSLTFFAPDQELRVQLRSPDPNHLRVASVDEIFRLKCIACANRSKTRDWLDIYTLFERGLFQPIDMIEAFERSATLRKLDIALARMCSGQPDRDDEGYATLLASAPSVKTMQERFKAARDEIEVELARRIN